MKVFTVYREDPGVGYSEELQKVPLQSGLGVGGRGGSGHECKAG